MVQKVKDESGEKKEWHGVRGQWSEVVRGVCRGLVGGRGRVQRSLQRRMVGGVGWGGEGKYNSDTPRGVEERLCQMY